jgi:hypothetical protein
MLEPVTGKIASTIATRVAGAAFKPLGEKARDFVLGSPEEVATERAIRTAITRAVDEASGQGLSREMAQHVLEMLEHLFVRQYPGGSTVINASDPEAALRYWRDAAEAAGWDLATFPLHFPVVVRYILEYIPEALRDEASKHDSPLFNQNMVTALTDLEACLDAILATSGIALSVVIPVAKPLRRKLDTAVQAARSVDQAFVTPHLLLELIRSRESPTSHVLDYTRQGLAKEIEEILSAYLATARLGKFVDLDWRERPEVQAARVTAARQASPVVTEGHLLVGILETPSNTQKQLVEWLGAELVGKAREAALGLHDVPRIGTPGIVFPGKGLGASS